MKPSVLKSKQSLIEELRKNILDAVKPKTKHEVNAEIRREILEKHAEAVYEVAVIGFDLLTAVMPLIDHEGLREELAKHINMFKQMRSAVEGD